MLGTSGGFAPWTRLNPTRSLQPTPGPQLEVAMTFRHCVSYLRHHGSYFLLQRELLQKHRELPDSLTNFKGVTVTLSHPLIMGPYIMSFKRRYYIDRSALDSIFIACGMASPSLALENVYLSLLFMNTLSIYL